MEQDQDSAQTHRKGETSKRPNSEEPLSNIERKKSRMDSKELDVNMELTVQLASSSKTVSSNSESRSSFGGSGEDSYPAALGLVRKDSSPENPGNPEKSDKPKKSEKPITKVSVEKVNGGQVWRSVQTLNNEIKKEKRSFHFDRSQGCAISSVYPHLWTKWPTFGSSI